MTRSAILVVDDEKTILDSLRGQLRTLFGSRYLVETADDAEEAWEVLEDLERVGVDVVVVVSDWLMPGMRGDEFLAAVRVRFPRTGRVLLTGQADAEAIRRARDDARVFEVIRKPWSAEALQAAIAGAAG